MNKNFHKYMITIDKLTISYIDTLKGEKSLLLLHGWSGKGSHWKTVANYLCEAGFRVVMLDIPGFGDSDVPPANWTFEDYVEATGKFIERVVGSPVVVIGHSFGGGIGICLAEQKSELVSALVLVDSVGTPLHRSLVSLAFRKIAETLFQGFSLTGPQLTMWTITSFISNLVTRFFTLWRTLKLVNEGD